MFSSLQVSSNMVIQMSIIFLIFLIFYIYNTFNGKINNLSKQNHDLTERCIQLEKYTEEDEEDEEEEEEEEPDTGEKNKDIEGFQPEDDFATLESKEN